MPILLLAHGDPAAKDKLRAAIEARYGSRPIGMDSLEIDFKGRMRTKIGPITTWIPMDMVAYFRFPTAMRLDFIAKPLKLPVQQGVESFDGEVYRSTRGKKEPTIIADDNQVQSMQRRAWAVAATLLIPLSELFVKLELIGNYSFSATNTTLDDTVEISLLSNNLLDKVQVECFNPDTEKQQMFSISLSDDLTTIDDLLIPTKFIMTWDDKPSFELEPTKITSNPDLPDSLFRLEDYL